MKVLLVLFGVPLCMSQMYQKTKLKDVEVLTLYQGKMTNGRRSSPVPQLQCMGGTAGCAAFVPEIVQCYNRGSDGLDVQWECKADMDNEYRFGKIEVTCEGYDYPEDKYILAGSCGLEYTIDLTKGGAQQKQNANSYQSYNQGASATKSSDSEVNWVAIAIVCFFCWVLWTNLTSNNETAPPPYNPDFIPPAGTVPPAGTAPPPYSNQQGPCPPGTQGWRPGFWTGAGAGWFGNSWFGGRNRGWGNNWGGYNRHRGGAQGAYNSGFTDGASTSSSHTRTSQPTRTSSPSTSSGTRTASGFGGTKRR